MNKLILNILILFLLFVSSCQLSNIKKDNKTKEEEIHICIKNIINSCHNLYSNKNLSLEYQNKKCIGYCHEFLHTKLQKFMKIKNIPHTDFSKIAKKLQEKWNKPHELFKIISINFVNEYKNNLKRKINNALGDKASKIASEIKQYSMHVVTICFKKRFENLRNNCIMETIQYMLNNTLSHYSMVTFNEIGNLVIKMNNSFRYESLGLEIIKYLKKRTNNKKLRKLNESEDSLYENIIKLYKSFCSLFD